MQMSAALDSMRMPSYAYKVHNIHLRYINWRWEVEQAGNTETRARIFKRLWSPGINSKEWIPPAYVAWRAGRITLFLLGS
jgi:hypothetical protein